VEQIVTHGGMKNKL